MKIGIYIIQVYTYHIPIYCQYVTLATISLKKLGAYKLCIQLYSILDLYGGRIGWTEYLHYFFFFLKRTNY